MRYNDVNNILKQVPDGKHILLMLDFDGTLTPIRRMPELARLSRRTSSLLHLLSKLPGLTLAFISGRTVKSLRGLAGIRNAYYVGEHGMEFSGPGLAYDYCSPVSSRLLAGLKRMADGELSRTRGVYIESKKHSFCVHYRNVSRKEVDSVLRRAGNILEPCEAKGLITIMHGKKVLEIRPPAKCDKGTAVLHLIRHFRKKYGSVFPLFAGDDVSDEAAFTALRKTGLTVHVGSSAATAAEFRLRDIGSMIYLLESLAGLIRKSAPAHRTDDRRSRS